MTNTHDIKTGETHPKPAETTHTHAATHKPAETHAEHKQTHSESATHAHETHSHAHSDTHSKPAAKLVKAAKHPAKAKSEKSSKPAAKLVKPAKSAKPKTSSAATHKPHTKAVHKVSASAHKSKSHRASASHAAAAQKPGARPPLAGMTPSYRKETNAQATGSLFNPLNMKSMMPSSMMDISTVMAIPLQMCDMMLSPWRQIFPSLPTLSETLHSGKSSEKSESYKSRYSRK